MEQNVIAGSNAQVTESSFVSRVFLWMALGLSVSAAGSAWLIMQPELLKTIVSNQLIFFGLIIVELGMVLWLSMALMKISANVATGLFLGYSFLNGVTLTPILLMYTGASVLSTFVITAGTFLFFSFYGLTTKKDLTSLGSLMVMGLFGVILASLVNMFIKNSTFGWIITFAAIAVFLGLIAYDTQKLKKMYAAGFESEQVLKKMVVIGALALYLDFVNLFIRLLQIFGKRRS